ncbi:sulfotransferase family 2 domain-containing protein [Roseobacteraceae bacterium S113]
MPITVPALKLAYSPLPKAGCSTVKRMLAMIDPDIELPPEAEWRQDLWHQLYPTLRHRSDRWEATEGFHRFAVVRDPAKRLMSVYTNRVVQFQDLRNSPRLRKPENAHLVTDPDPDFFFANLEEYKDLSSVIKHHILPAELFVGADLGAYDAVYRTEEMGALAGDLGARAGKTIDIARENSSTMSLKLSDLKPETIEAIRPRLNAEYALLSDYFDNPL